MEDKRNKTQRHTNPDTQRTKTQGNLITKELNRTT